MSTTVISAGGPALLETPRYVLGEGPAFDAATGRLSWIDIEEGLVLAAPFSHVGLGPIRTLELGGVVGCALPLSGGRFLVALESWIGVLHPSGRIEKSTPLGPAGSRFNDGKIDPQGRLVVGTLRRWSVAEDQRLIRLESDGSIAVLDDDLHQSNGLGWSPDGSVFYNADTHLGRIYRRSYVDGVAGRRSTFADLDGVPDGLTVDTDGNLWITIFDRERVDCYAPDGTRQAHRTVELPGYHPASVEFAGPRRDRLVVTSGYPRLDGGADSALRTELDGGLLTVEVGATGVAPTSWAEIPLP